MTTVGKPPLERSKFFNEASGPPKPGLSHLKLKQIVQEDETLIYGEQTLMMTADEAPHVCAFRSSTTSNLKENNNKN